MSLPIQIVNEKDQPVGQATKQDAWAQGLWHRVVRIMLTNDRGEVLLQHRAASKDIFPDCWDNSSAGHVDVGEDYLAAAKRELTEELGITDVTLEEIGYYQSDETWHEHRFKRFAKVYRAQYNKTPPQLEAGKVDDARWFTVEAVEQLVADHPEQVSDGLRQVVERFYSADV